MSTEWRVFVPLDSPKEDSHWVKSCEEVIDSFVASSNPQEDRSDEYFITCEEFGLKYRNGEKLELKVRTYHNMEHGIECYSKVKLGKKKLSKQVEHIHAILQEHGHSQKELYTEVLTNPKSIVISKSRRSRYDEVSHIAVEVCRITVDEGRGIHLTGPRNWISLSLESHDVVPIQQYLTSTLLGKDLIKALRCLAESNQNLPCVSGYPGWIKYLSNFSSTENLSLPAIIVHPECI